MCCGVSRSRMWKQKTHTCQTTARNNFEKIKILLRVRHMSLRYTICVRYMTKSTQRCMHISWVLCIITSLKTSSRTLCSLSNATSFRSSPSVRVYVRVCVCVRFQLQSDFTIHQQDIGSRQHTHSSVVSNWSFFSSSSFSSSSPSSFSSSYSFYFIFVTQNFGVLCLVTFCSLHRIHLNKSIQMKYGIVSILL